MELSAGPAVVVTSSSRTDLLCVCLGVEVTADVEVEGLVVVVTDAVDDFVDDVDGVVGVAVLFVVVGSRVFVALENGLLVLGTFVAIARFDAEVFAVDAVVDGVVEVVVDVVVVVVVVREMREVKNCGLNLRYGLRIELGFLFDFTTETGFTVVLVDKPAAFDFLAVFDSTIFLA